MIFTNNIFKKNLPVTLFFGITSLTASAGAATSFEVKVEGTRINKSYTIMVDINKTFNFFREKIEQKIHEDRKRDYKVSSLITYMPYRAIKKKNYTMSLKEFNSNICDKKFKALVKPRSNAKKREITLKRENKKEESDTRLVDLPTKGTSTKDYLEESNPQNFQGSRRVWYTCLEVLLNLTEHQAQYQPLSRDEMRKFLEIGREEEIHLVGVIISQRYDKKFISQYKPFFWKRYCTPLLASQTLSDVTTFLLRELATIKKLEAIASEFVVLILTQWTRKHQIKNICAVQLIIIDQFVHAIDPKIVLKDYLPQLVSKTANKIGTRIDYSGTNYFTLL